MPPIIEVEEISASEFRVRVNEGASGSAHRVTVSPEDCRRIAGGKLQPTELVRHSFEFLLEREPKESILGQIRSPRNLSLFPRVHTGNGPPLFRAVTLL